MPSKYDDDIKVMGSDLAVGERSPHLVCPQCMGGPSREASLLIWADPNSLTAKCYRVKCGFFTNTGVTGCRKISTKVRQPKTKVSQLNPERLPDDVTDWLCYTFKWLTPDDLYLNGVQWDENAERVLYPIRSLDGKEEGLLARKYPELVLNESNLKGVKAKTYWNTVAKDYKLTCLMPPRNAAREDYIVLVEDYPSAMRLNQDIPCTALSGTSIQDASLMNLKKVGIRHVVMVLDGDAVAKASKLVHNYSPFFHSMSFIPLRIDDPDPKDMTNAAYDKLLHKIIERFPNGVTDSSELLSQARGLHRRRSARSSR